MNLQERLLYRFLRYSEIATQSKPGCDVVPSTESQWDLAKLLMKDLEELGVVDISLSDHCVVIGRLPARLPEGHAPVPTVGWVAHMDTVDVALSPKVNPVVIRNYDGTDICQNAEKQLYLRTAEHPELLKYIGQDIVVSDGTSVLGADDKAAIANIMTALEVLNDDPSIPHGEIYIAFVPDEETGLKGAKSMELDKFPVKFAYTIDCCELGELVYQTFNAGQGTIKIKGVTAHPMSSKNNTVNPILIAVDFVNMLDRGETPEHTEKTEGYIWIVGIEGNALYTSVHYQVRDHSKVKYEAKKQYVRDCVEMLKKRHPKAELSIEYAEHYGNINDAISPEDRKCVDYLFTAMNELDIPIKDIAMRGGTDGSYLSTQGIPTPNYFTGAHNFHAVSEFLPMGSIEMSCRTTLKLIELITKG